MATTSRDAARAQTAQRILDAARQEFAERSFESATIRRIAEEAGVDASLVMQHYGSKAALFAAAVRLPGGDERAAADHLADVLALRLQDLPPQTRALLRSMLTVPEAERAVRGHLDERIDNLTRTLGGPDAQLRAALIVSTVLGLTIGRHFLGLRVFDDVPRESLLRAAEDMVAAHSRRSAPD